MFSGLLDKLICSQNKASRLNGYVIEEGWIVGVWGYGNEQERGSGVIWTEGRGGEGPPRVMLLRKGGGGGGATVTVTGTGK